MTARYDTSEVLLLLPEVDPLLRLTANPLVRDIAFAPSGDFMLGESYDGLVVWELPSFEQRATVTIPLGRSFTETPLTTSEEGDLLIFDHHILSLAGFWKHLASGLESPPPIEELPGLRFESGTNLAFSRDGRVLLAQSVRGIEVWNIDPARCVRRDPAFGTEFALSPDGVLLALADPNEWVVHVRRTRRKQEVARLAHSNSIHRVVFSPDGRLLATMTGHPSRVSLWDVETWTRVAQLKAFRKRGTSLEFSADGRMLAAGGLEGIVRVWDVTTHRELESLDLEIGPLWRVTLAPDGMTGAALGEEGQIVVWDLDDE